MGVLSDSDEFLYHVLGEERQRAEWGDAAVDGAEESATCTTCKDTGACPRCQSEGVVWVKEDCTPSQCPLCGGDGGCYDCT